MDFTKIQTKIQNLPEKKRKAILWAIVIIIGGILLFFWFQHFVQKMENFNKEGLLKEIKLPKLEK